MGSTACVVTHIYPTHPQFPRKTHVCPSHPALSLGSHGKTGSDTCSREDPSPADRARQKCPLGDGTQLSMSSVRICRIIVPVVVAESSHGRVQAGQAAVGLGLHWPWPQHLRGDPRYLSVLIWLCMLHENFATRQEI